MFYAYILTQVITYETLQSVFQRHSTQSAIDIYMMFIQNAFTTISKIHIPLYIFHYIFQTLYIIPLVHIHSYKKQTRI